MIQEASSMKTTQSFICGASSFNMKCSFCLREEFEQQHDYFISRVKKLTDSFKERSHNIDVQWSKKILQPLKCGMLKNSISQTLYIISEKKEKEKKTKEDKEKENKAKEEEEEEKDKKANEEKEKENKAKEEEEKKKKAKQEKKSK